MPKLYVREFLNLPEHGSAFILAEAEMRRGALDATLTLSDCNRQLHIDFSIYGEDDYANVRHKSALLRRTVNELLDLVDARLEALSMVPAER